MANKYTAYKKRRLLILQQRIRDLEKENDALRAENVELTRMNSELQSENYYLRTR